MTTKRVLVAAALTTLMAWPLGAMAQSTDAATPERGPDGRVAPTIKPNPEAFAWTTVDERIKKLENANKERNELLAKFPLPLAVAVRVPDGSIKVDGMLDDAAWKQAKVITNFRDKATGDVVKQQTRIRLLWDSKYLYIGVECDDDYLTAVTKEHDGDVWNDDALEWFINPSGDEMSYLDFDINPLGTWYDASIADYRPEVNWKANGKHLDIEKSYTSFDTKDSKWVVHVDGTVKSDEGATTQPAQPDKGWTAEIAIAWTDIARGTNVIHAVPQDGDIWRLNFCRVDKAADSENDTFSAWNPTDNWFQRPWAFGRVVFINGDQNPTPAGSDDAAAKPAKKHKHKKKKTDAAATQPAPAESSDQ